MSLKDILYGEQFRDRKEIDEIQDSLDRMGVKRMTDIRIYRYDKDIYEGIVGTWDGVFVFRNVLNHLQLYAVEPIMGFLPNGGLIRIAPDWKRKLLKALTFGDEDEIIKYATEAFILGDEEDWEWDVERVKEFEKFACCKVGIGPVDSLGWASAEIRYDNETFFLGRIYFNPF
jgi:hypothetical protein